MFTWINWTTVFTAIGKDRKSVVVGESVFVGGGRMF